MITLEQAKALKVGDILYSPYFTNTDGTPRQYKVSGKVKTSKRIPGMVKIPLKFGIHIQNYLTRTDLHLICLTVDEAIAERERSI